MLSDTLTLRYTKKTSSLEKTTARQYCHVKSGSAETIFLDVTRLFQYLLQKKLRVGMKSFGLMMTFYTTLVFRIGQA